MKADFSSRKDKISTVCYSDADIDSADARSSARALVVASSLVSSKENEGEDDSGLHILAMLSCAVHPEFENRGNRKRRRIESAVGNSADLELSKGISGTIQFRLSGASSSSPVWL